MKKENCLEISNVIIKYNIFTFVPLIAAVLAPIYANAQPDLQSCVRIENDTARLACYDELANPTEESFGLENKAESVAEAPEEIANVVAKVTTATHSDFTGWTISFDNGQSWKQIGTDRFDVNEGDSCTISRGLLNSFRLQCGSIERKIRVTRSE